MHTMYEVVDASVNHSGSSRSLRVKLTVSPEPFGKRREGPSAGPGEGPGPASQVPWGPCFKRQPTSSLQPPPARPHCISP